MTEYMATADSLPADALSSLYADFSGELIRPDDDGYDDARSIWNGAIDRRPGLIARCADASDVVRSIRFAREHDLLTSVRSGGHSVGGLSLCDAGLVIDLSAMKEVKVDLATRRVKVQAGVTLGELDRETQTFDLAVPAGIVTHTGVAGLTLGGGIGWLMRAYGLTVDNLRAADVVTADGGSLTASPDEHADLFWGLRGGGGNFGVVTSFEFDAHPVGPIVLAGPMFFPLERVDEIMGAYREWVSDAPDELTTILNFRRAPAASFVPEHLHGTPVLMVMACWSGAIEDGEHAIAPIRAMRPVLDLCAPKPFLEHQSMLDVSATPGWHFYWKSLEVPEMSPQVVDVIVGATERITSPRSYTIVFQLGGAVSRVGERDTAYGHRDAGFAININSVWLPEEAAEADRHIAWTRDMFKALEPLAGGVYVNFLGDEGEDRVRAAYGPAAYDRLASIKARYDPTNFFRLNQNIRPAR